MNYFILCLSFVFQLVTVLGSQIKVINKAGLPINIFLFEHSHSETDPKNKVHKNPLKNNEEITIRRDVTKEYTIRFADSFIKTETYIKPSNVDGLATVTFDQKTKLFVVSITDTSKPAAEVNNVNRQQERAAPEKPVPLKVVNKTGKPVNLFWFDRKRINEDVNLVLQTPKPIPPHSDTTVWSYVNHTFVVHFDPHIPGTEAEISKALASETITVTYDFQIRRILATLTHINDEEVHHSTSSSTNIHDQHHSSGSEFHKYNRGEEGELPHSAHSLEAEKQNPRKIGENNKMGSSSIPGKSILYKFIV